MLTIIAAAVACGLIGGGTGYLYRKKIAEGKIGQTRYDSYERLYELASQIKEWELK